MVTVVTCPLNSEKKIHLRNVLAEQGLVVVPTDTVYGIGAIPTDAAAVDKLLRAKGRGRDYPSPVLIGDVGNVDDIAQDVSPAARVLMEKLWPGALTIVVSARKDVGWDLGVTQGTVALRMPDHKALLTILNDVGPLAVTSANLHGQPPATTVVQAVKAFGELVDIYVDDGPSPGGRPSTIVRCDTHNQGGGIKVLREGAVSFAMIADCLGHDYARYMQGSVENVLR
ncbi:MAG: L-threonylcarbamoyladenylate synthase [Actinomycetaceae bacterium]|nr:L-threonylcarbamoyladenylate synthase [Actinomycetaceae bacterium]